LSLENQASLKALGNDTFRIFIEDVSTVAGERTKLMEGKYYNGSATYYRAFVPRLFPQYKKVVYLDSDLVVKGDVSELYATRLGPTKYVGAIIDEVVDKMPVFVEYKHKFMEMPGYFNAGVLVINTEALRKINFEDRFFDILAKIKLEVAPDQDVFNVITKGKIRYVDGAWNKMSIMGDGIPTDKVKIVHYNLTAKPWLSNGNAYSDLFWEYAKKTQYYKDIKAMRGLVTPATKTASNEKLNAIAKIASDLCKGPSIFQLLTKADEDEYNASQIALGLAPTTPTAHCCASCGACATVRA